MILTLPSPSPSATSAADTVAAIDPTALALLSIFGGAALTVIAGFIGAAIQSRREHTRWLREQRLEAFVSARAWTDRAIRVLGDHAKVDRQKKAGGPGAKRELDKILAERDELLRASADSRAPLAVLGPTSVDEALSKLVVHVKSGDKEALEQGWKKVLTLMRETLDIK